MSEIQDMEQEASKALAVINIAVVTMHAWQNRPDCFDGWKAIDRLASDLADFADGKEFDFDGWLTHPNGDFK